MLDNPTLAMLKYRAFPELAEALRRRSATILERLQTAVKETLPDADELTFRELRDHLPGTLDQMANALEATNSQPTKIFIADSGEHGECRYHQSFNLDELLIEYSLIRSIVVEELTAELGRSLKLDEIVTVNVGLDAASRRAVTEFVRHQTIQMQNATESQSKYLSFLSHDLRGALNGILLMLEVLKRELGGSGQFETSLEDIDLMKRSILDTVSTMDRFLHAEKFRKGKVEVRLSEVSIPALLAEVTNQVSLQAKGKGVAVRTDTSKCKTLATDRDLLSLILQNFLGNAIKYSTGGEVTITAEETHTKGCRISIRDQGPGIAANKLSTLFDPFVRGETHGQGGVGLGLSIARQAADLLKAKLWAESEIGKGSTFHVELPAAKS